MIFGRMGGGMGLMMGSLIVPQIFKLPKDFPVNGMTYTGQPLTLGGDYLTVGVA